MTSILTIKNKGAEYRLLLPEQSPAQVCHIIWRAIDANGNPIVADMGRLSMYLIRQSITTSGARLLEGPILLPHIKHKVQWLLTLDRPDRSLQLDLREVLWNDNTRYFNPVWSGAFYDFKKYLHAIIENNLGGTK